MPPRVACLIRAQLRISRLLFLQAERFVAARMCRIACVSAPCRLGGPAKTFYFHREVLPGEATRKGVHQPGKWPVQAEGEGDRRPLPICVHDVAASSGHGSDSRLPGEGAAGL